MRLNMDYLLYHKCMGHSDPFAGDAFPLLQYVLRGVKEWINCTVWTQRVMISEGKLEARAKARGHLEASP